MNATLSSSSNGPCGNGLGDPHLWRTLAKDLARTVRRRIDHVEVEDVVQSTLEEALAAKALPSAQEEIRRFVFAIARQKIADVYRRREREQRRTLRSECMQQPFTEPGAELGAAAGANALQTWVERTLPEAPTAKRTLEWMLREADGETLAEIAANDRVSAAMVRQRVSRLRRWLRARWAKEVAGLTVMVVVAFALAAFRSPSAATNESRRREGIHQDPSAKPALPDPSPSAVPPSEPEPEPAVLSPPKNPGPRVRARTKPPVPTLPPGTSSAQPVSSAPITAHLNVRRATTRAANGQLTTETTYDLVSLPSLPIATCATETSPRGVSHIDLTFRADGSVESARVDSGVLVGRPEAACVERLFSSRVRIRPIEGGPVVAGTFFRVIPEAPPAWTRPSD